MFSDADLLEMHRRMLRDPRVRAAGRRALPRRRGARASCTSRSGRRRRPSARAGRCGPADVITSTHRGHGHCLAKGLDPLGMFAELMAQGRGHEPRPRRLDAHRRPDARHLRRQRHRRRRACRSRWARRPPRSCARDGSVAVAFFGDGAVAHGTFHEAVNLAAVWQLPVIFFCENNGYAEFSPASTQHAAPLEQRAAGYGVDYVAVDGNDVVATAARDAGRWSTRVRAGGGPVVVEADDLPLARPLRRRPAALPVARRGAGVGGARPARSSTRAGSATRASPTTTIEALRVVGRRRARRRRRRRAAADGAGGRHADRLRRPRRGPSAPSRRRRAADAPVFRTMDAIRAALEAELADRRAGVRRRHRRRRRRQRVRAHARPARPVRRSRARHADLRDARSSGLGVGAAMAGMRPVVELMYLDFLGVCLDQLLNQAAKLPFMTGGAARDGADRAHAVRRRPLVGQPALAEPRGAARAHPRPDASSCRRRRPTPTGCCAPRSRTRTRSCSSRTGCSTA